MTTNCWRCEAGEPKGMHVCENIVATTTNEWEKEFYKFSESIRGGRNGRGMTAQDTVSFITSLLAAEREKCAEKIRGLGYELTPREESIAAGMTEQEAKEAWLVGTSYLAALTDAAKAIRGV